MKKLLSLLLIVCCVTVLFGCNTSETPDSKTETPVEVPTDEPVTEPEPTPVTYLYTAYEADGTVIGGSDSIWNAIVQARDKSKSSNKCYVIKTDTNTEVYKYSTSTYYCFLTNEFVKSTKDETAAIKWAKAYPNSYVMNGKATEFVYVGKKIDTKYGLDKDSVYGVENQSGPYGFLYSKPANELPNGKGYTYVQFKVELSKAKLKYYNDQINETGWNAYVFANMTMSSPWVSCDIGIMNISSGTPGGWVPCFNIMGNMYNPGKHAGIVSQMHYNETTGYYENGDDLLITCWIWSKYFVLNIKNLNPNSECYNRDESSDKYGTKEWEFLCEIPVANFNAATTKLLLAASNCPVGTNTAGTFWNPLCGNAFENVIFSNMKVAQWGSHSSTSEYGYNHSGFSYALTMGAANADIKHGTNSEGQYFILNMYNYAH